MKFVTRRGLPEDAITIRKKVFVEEQGFRDEFDDIDKIALHLIVYDDGLPIATGRVFPRDMDGKVYKMGRVALLPPYRGAQIGRKVVLRLEEEAKAAGAEKVELSAQCRVQGFYERLDYIADGDIYEEESCPHIHMEKMLI